MSTLSPKNDELTPISDDWEPSDKEIANYWSGEGHLVFTVRSYDPNTHYCPYEIEYEDYSGCVGGLDEMVGIEYAVNEGILDVGKLHIGCTYEVHGITAHFTRGDGWTTDDDVEYYIESVTQYAVLHQLIYAWWWHLVGHRIRNWQNARSKT
ncbi:hypothetical protein [Roseovarius sp. 217 phage 1]|uniref:Uncharacterized protein n=1 Tax=Roseovarius sp. 217 phage 1 TaxID=874471 RepID=E3PZ64_9CAUD|nr:hypothetical protein [Roseovarius sp. 217 phage 1]